MADDAKPSLNRLHTRPTERNWTMAKMGVGTGMRVAGHNLANFFRSPEQREASDREFYRVEAEKLAAQLGELKGSVMKAGQMLSLYGQYFMPPEAIEALSSLQDDTVHVDWSVVAPVVQQALGQRSGELDIEREPIAAASLGQAHTAYLKENGRKLCLKIRYPGVDEAIDSDVKTISRLLSFSRLVPQDLSLDPVLTEVREMLHREVDYVHEADMTQQFRDSLADDSRYIVADILERYSSSELLTMSFEEGRSLNDAAVRGLSQSRRNRLGQAFLELFLKEFFVWHLVQTDPHFGNYRIRLHDDEQDQIVLLDFGATRRFPKQFVEDYGHIVGGALARDKERVIAGARGIGLMGENFPPAVLDGFYQLCCLIVEPFSVDLPDAPQHLYTDDGAYRWGESDLPSRVTMTIAKAALTRHFKIPPREIVFLHRRLAGVFIVLAHLNVELDARELLRTVLAE